MGEENLTPGASVNGTGNNNISLEDYSIFQYMLARPAVVKTICNHIPSFVFYHEARDERKMESEHKVLVQGSITVINYYCCALLLLPSHILGMSRWLSAEDCQSGAGKMNRKTRQKQHEQQQPGDVLRRFRYCYYCGLLQVETHHVCIGHANDYVNDQRFRLVEYLDFPISLWALAYAVFSLAALLVGYCVRVRHGYEISFLVLIASAVVLLHLVLILTGVRCG